MRTYSADFETSVYEGQTTTEVWSSAFVELGTENVIVHGSIEETFRYFVNLNQDVTLYYHNLKFDGSFWLDFLMRDTDYTQAFTELDDTGVHFEAMKRKEMPFGSFLYSITTMGQWYLIRIRTEYGKYIEIRDSLKLLPFSVKQIGQAFKTKHQKLDMEYVGERHKNCTITEEERKYIENDVLVVKEALEMMFEEGHDKLTIGACCLSEFKKISKDSEAGGLFMDDNELDQMMPDLTEYYITDYDLDALTMDEYIRRSYRGGWCYVKKDRQGKMQYNGGVVDVNSLYPSMMHSESGNYYPVGAPHPWKGSAIPEEALKDGRFFFIRFRCRFELKEGFLPFIQIKGSKLYKPTDCLETSDFIDKRGNRSRYYKDKSGTHDTVCTFTMTQVDWYLFHEHYNIFDLEILDGVWFHTMIGIFDSYINKYAEIKKREKGAKRTLAKLFLNNLYGKMAMNTDSSFKYAQWSDEKDKPVFIDVEEHNKKPGYIPIGSAITSYARNFTIRAAQKNYERFCYADTDSIHYVGTKEELIGVPLHSVNFCCWKAESMWDYAKFERQKTYVEHIIEADGEPVEPHLDLKCAGLPERCKQLFIMSMKDYEEYTEKELELYHKQSTVTKEWLVEKRTIDDFKEGLSIPAKLLPVRIHGGIVLQETWFTMR